MNERGRNLFLGGAFRTMYLLTRVPVKESGKREEGTDIQSMSHIKIQNIPNRSLSKTEENKGTKREEDRA